MSGRKIRLLHMYPNVLDLYGDSGNVEVLKFRCQKRGIELSVHKHLLHEMNCTDFESADIIYLGGGADYEQQLLADDLMSCREEIATAYKNGAFMLMICGGYQLMGQYYKDSNGKKIPGLGLFPYHTQASKNKRQRCIGNIVLDAVLDGESYKVIGFENHGGMTRGADKPFGKVLCGNGNDRTSGFEGYAEKNVIATYLHGPLLSKNPKLADHIISYCLKRGGESGEIAPLDDSLENECREILLGRLL